MIAACLLAGQEQRQCQFQTRTRALAVGDSSGWELLLLLLLLRLRKLFRQLVASAQYGQLFAATLATAARLVGTTRVTRIAGPLASQLLLLPLMSTTHNNNSDYHYY